MHIEYLNEVWKDIKGYKGLYQVSNLGRVRKIKDYSILNTYLIHKGYLRVSLGKNCIFKNKLVHRLVAEAFISNPNNYPCVNHINEIKTDNRVENLEWCDYSYNVNYGTRNVRVSKILLNRKDESKIVLQYDLDDNFIKEWPSVKEIERTLGYRRTDIVMICNKYKNRKTAFGYRWEFKKDTE